MNYQPFPQRCLLPRLSSVNEGPGLSQEHPGLLPFSSGIKAETEALWLETKIGLNEEGDGGGGHRGLGNSAALLWGPESLDRKGQVLPHSPTVLPNIWGRQFWLGGAGERALPRRQGGAVLGPAAMQWGEGQSRSGRVRGGPQPPAAPALVGESVVGQAWPTGPSATAPWG